MSANSYPNVLVSKVNVMLLDQGSIILILSLLDGSETQSPSFKTRGQDLLFL